MNTYTVSSYMQKNSIPIGSMYDIFTRWWAFQIFFQFSPLKLGKMNPCFTLVKGVGEKPPTSLPPFTSPKSTIHGLVYIPNMDPVRNDVIFLVASPGGHQSFMSMSNMVRQEKISTDVVTSAMEKYGLKLEPRHCLRLSQGWHLEDHPS